jgi:hypothetical protein
MFTPTNSLGPTGITVPLRKVHWTWNGTGVLSGTNWNLTTNPEPDKNPGDADALDFPRWTNNILNFTFHPE